MRRPCWRPARLPEPIRGHGHVKEANAEKASKVREALWAEWDQDGQAAVARAA